MSLVTLVMLDGFETEARDQLQYLLAYDCVFGLVVGRYLWIAAFPAIYYFIFVPIWHDGLSGGGHDVTYTYPIGEFALLATLAIAAGLAANVLGRYLWRHRAQARKR